MTRSIKEQYKQLTDDIFQLYECFKRSGFTEEQAFELVNTYVRQTMFDNVMQSAAQKRPRNYDAIKQYINNIKKEEKENEKDV